MSEPFTVNGDNFQTLEKLEQLRLAFSERVYTCLPRAYPLPPGSHYSITAPLYKNFGVANGNIVTLTLAPDSKEDIIQWLLTQHPELGNPFIKSILWSDTAVNNFGLPSMLLTGRLWSGNSYSIGIGYITATVQITWPGEGDEDIVQTIMYRELHVFTDLEGPVAEVKDWYIPSTGDAGKMAAGRLAYYPPYGTQRYAWDLAAGAYKWLDAAENLPVSSGINLQSVEFFRKMQIVVACECNRFAKPVTFDENNNPIEPYSASDVHGVFPALGFGAASPADAAKEFFKYVGGGLYKDADNWGLRRAFETDENGNPRIIRGLAEPGDFLGSWIIEDLVACFSKMTAVATTQNARLHPPGQVPFDPLLETNHSGAWVTLVSYGGHVVYREALDRDWISLDVPWDGRIYYAAPESDYYAVVSHWAVVSVAPYGTPLVPIVSVRKYYGIAPATTLSAGTDYVSGASVPLGGRDGGDIGNGTENWPAFVINWDFTNAGFPPPAEPPV